MTKFKVIRYWDTYPDGVVAICNTEEEAEKICNKYRRSRKPMYGYLVRKEANMQDVKITLRVRVTEDERRVIITDPTMTDYISFNVFMGIVRSLVDFVNEWNEEHKPEKQRAMTQEEEIQHIKKLKDAGFDCSTSRSIDETIQLLKLLKGETRKI